MTNLQKTRRSSVSASLIPVNTDTAATVNNPNNQVKNFLIRYTECYDTSQYPLQTAHNNKYGTIIDPPNINNARKYSNSDDTLQKPICNSQRSSITNAIPHPTLLITTTTPPINTINESYNHNNITNSYLSKSYNKNSTTIDIEHSSEKPLLFTNSTSNRQQYTLPRHATTASVPYSPQLQPSPSSPSMRNHHISGLYRAT